MRRGGRALARLGTSTSTLTAKSASTGNRCRSTTKPLFSGDLVLRTPPHRKLGRAGSSEPSIFNPVILGRTRGGSSSRQSSLSFATARSFPAQREARLHRVRNYATRAQLISVPEFFKVHNEQQDDITNVTDRIVSKVGTNLHQRPNHPINTIKKKIENFFVSTFRDQSTGQPVFRTFDDIKPLVSVKENFDDLLFPLDHVGRTAFDTYYLNKTRLLRTHTTTHQTQLLREGHRAFLITGDVYRRDEIDRTHYPVFHQMDGVRLFPTRDLESQGHSTPADQNRFVEMDMKRALEGMVQQIFGKVQIRWVDAYFPFTDPSWEMEIFFDNNWLEVLGCGLIQHDILKGCGLRGKEKDKEKENIGWAFGLGLERLAMVLFDIPDIRLFWSEDRRFVDQFKSGEIIKFQPYSKYPPCLKDIAFWVPPGFHVNAFFELVGQVAGDLVERVEVIDQFVHPKTQEKSVCFRITYRSMDRSLTNEEINDLQNVVREQSAEKLKVTLR